MSQHQLQQLQQSHDNFNSILNEWNLLDKKMEEYNLALKKLKEKKDKVEKLVLEKMDMNNIEDFKLSNFRYSIGNDNNYTTLSYKYIKEKMTKLFKDEGKANKVIEYLKDERAVKKNKILRRNEVKDNKK